MVLTKDIIQSMRQLGRQNIPRDVEDILLERLGNEPLPYTYTEQDIAEQSRKIIQQFHSPGGKLSPLRQLNLCEKTKKGKENERKIGNPEDEDINF